MKKPLSEIQLKDLPMGQPAKDALALVGIFTLEDIVKHNEEELLGLHGVGPKAIRIIKDHLANQHMTLPKR
ncbi:MAG TPA: hypothetical protein DEA51_06325 [Erysipelotrichaceae bacterium]|nr:hypothetical protein [Erysipelotrichaceae bacterium]